MKMHKGKKKGGLGCATGHYYERQEGGIFQAPTTAADMEDLRKPALFYRPNITLNQWIRIPRFHEPYVALSKVELGAFVKNLNETYNTRIYRLQVQNHCTVQVPMPTG